MERKRETRNSQGQGERGTTPHLEERYLLRHRAALARGCREVLGDGALLEDAIQEAFARAWVWMKEHPERPDQRPCSWFYRVGSRAALDLLRREARCRAAPCPLALRDAQRAAQDPACEALRAELRERIEAALAYLPSQQRRVFLWRAWHGDSFRRIGCQIGCSKSTCRTHFRRARARLQRMLGAQVDPEWRSDLLAPGPAGSRRGGGLAAAGALGTAGLDSRGLAL
ncbi:MAG: sigma-70 family RNA polymerase sigma factor [Planctomycetota bacterium]